MNTRNTRPMDENIDVSAVVLELGQRAKAAAPVLAMSSSEQRKRQHLPFAPVYPKSWRQMRTTLKVSRAVARMTRSSTDLPLRRSASLIWQMRLMLSPVRTTL